MCADSILLWQPVSARYDARTFWPKNRIKCILPVKGFVFLY